MHLHGYAVQLFVDGFMALKDGLRIGETIFPARQKGCVVVCVTVNTWNHTVTHLLISLGNKIANRCILSITLLLPHCVEFKYHECLAL